MRLSDLEGRAGKKQSVLGAEEAVEDEGEFALVVLHAMSFVDDHVLPADFPQDALLLQHVVIGGEEHVELATSNLVLHLLPRVFVPLVDDLDHMGRPLV